VTLGGQLARRGRRGRRLLAATLVFAASAATSAIILAAGSGGGEAAEVAAGRCDTYGPVWVKSYNKTAIKQGNPVRMLSACCQPGAKKGVHHCFIIVTLAGTKDRGCAIYDLGPDGQPVGLGKHEACPQT
jgi:hypothetical protein